MLIPQKSGAVFRFRLSSLLLKIITILGALALFSSFAIFLDYIKIREKGQLQRLYEKKSLLQTFEFQEINNRLNNKRKELQKFEAFDRKLRLISGLQDSVSEIQYVGRISNSLKDDTLEFIDSRQVFEKIKKMDLDIKTLEISYFQLESYLQESKDRLARTPSIAPTIGYFSSRFGYRRDPFTKKRRLHQGVDWANKPYTPIYAPADGLVTFTDVNAGFGKFLAINHGYNIVTRYGHLEKYEVKVGQKVRRGDLIARMGNTGRSTATHLHYEVLLREQYVNPMKYVLE